MDDSLNTKILRRLGYHIVENPEFATENVLQLVSMDGDVSATIWPNLHEKESLEDYLYSLGPKISPLYLVKDLKWTAEHVPNRSSWLPCSEDYEVIVGDGFGEADTLEEAICVAWLDYMERKDRREQKLKEEGNE